MHADTYDDDVKKLVTLLKADGIAISEEDARLAVDRTVELLLLVNEELFSPRE